MGKVIKPHCSGVLTTSFVISLHNLQTEAHATSALRAGQEVSLASNLWIMSNSNSGGKLAHRLCDDDDGGGGGGGGKEHSGAMWDFPWRCTCLASPPLLYMLLMPSPISLSSRTMLLNGIMIGVVLSQPYYVWKEKSDIKV